MGNQFKFIHCADLHLDTPFKNVASDDRALSARMVKSSFDALDRIVDKAISENVDFIIFSGDIFDADSGTPGSRFKFAEALGRSGKRCYVAYGNHDYKRQWEDSIPFPENVIVFPDTVTNVPFPSEENKLTDVIGISHSVKEEPRDLTKNIRGSDAFSIAVVHCDVDSASEGRRYAPCRLDDLLNKNIDYWALGHIHKRNVMNEYPHVIYPGNTQGRSPKETGEKGAYIVTVTDNRVSNMTFFRTGPILWQEIEADITGRKNVTDLVSEITKVVEKGSMIRLRMVGIGELDSFVRLQKPAFIRVVEEWTSSKVESVQLSCVPNMDMEERKKTGDFSSVMIIESERIMAMSRDDMIDAICSSKASKNIRRIFEGMTDAELKEIVNDARMALLEKLTEGVR